MIAIPYIDRRVHLKPEVGKYVERSWFNLVSAGPESRKDSLIETGRLGHGLPSLGYKVALASGIELSEVVVPVAELPRVDVDAHLMVSGQSF